MNLDLLAWLAPLISVAFLFFLERCYFNVKSQTKQRIATILSIQAISIFINLALSTLILVPLVFLVAPLQIFSFSNLNVPIPISFILSFLFLDFVNYINHRLHHKIPFLWRFHRLHHSDQNMDSLTTFLHHPFELLTSFIVTIALAAIFDVPVIVLVIYGLIVGFHSAFTHFNILLPERTAKVLKFVLVTPNFHKTHHSININEGNTNFGILFVFWDYLFKTVCHKSNSELEFLTTGIDSQQSPEKFNVSSMFLNPFK